MREYRYVFTWVDQGKIITKHIYAPSEANAKEQLKNAFGKDANSPLVATTRQRA